MALSYENGSDIIMPVQPMGTNSYGNTGFGWGGDGSFWIIILFLFAMFGGWGNGFGGFGGYGSGGAMPYMMNQNTNNDVQRGFDQQAIMNGITGINNSLASAEVSRCNGVANITNAITNGFTGVQTSLANNQMGLYQAMNGNQMGLYQMLNGNHSDVMQAMNASNLAQIQNTNTLAAGLQQCCCDNRSGLADLKYSIATEACADRQAVNDGVRDLMASNVANTNALMNSINAGIQSINDKLCQQEIDALKTQNQNLTTQLNMANLAASQNAQTGQLLADNAAQTLALQNALMPKAPIPAYVVQNPNGCQCGYNYQPGCGCGNF